MFRESYVLMLDQISPGKILVENTIRQAERSEVRQKGNRLIYAVVATCVCLLVVLIPITAVAAGSETAYDLMYTVSPAAAQFFVPVRKSDTDNGIRMEVVSACVHENTAEIYVTMEDTAGDRVDGTIDLYDSYSINRPFDSAATCRFVGYEEEGKKATFLITITEWGNGSIEGDKITFSVREFLSKKKTYDGIETALDLDEISAADETKMIDQYSKSGSAPVKVLIPSEPMDCFAVEGIKMTGAAFIDGRLHIQTAVEDYTDNDNHGYFYLTNEAGEIFYCDDSVSFKGEGEKENITYFEYIFDVSMNEMSEYSLRGYFVVSGLKTEGNWRVTFPLEA